MTVYTYIQAYIHTYVHTYVHTYTNRSHWPRDEAWVFCRSLAGIAGSNPAGSLGVCRECCVLLSRCLCGGLITRPEESYRLWCVWVWPWCVKQWGEPWPTRECCAVSVYIYSSVLITWPAFSASLSKCTYTIFTFSLYRGTSPYRVNKPILIALIAKWVWNAHMNLWIYSVTVGCDEMP